MYDYLKKGISLLLLYGISLNLAAQQYGYVQYNSESGAPFSEVNTVLHDEEGFVWIGSQNGLYKFDGIHFDLFSIHTESQSIHQIHSNKNRLFFVNDKGLYEIEDLTHQPQLDVLLEGSIKATDTLPFYPNDFILATDETVWMSQSNHSIGRWQDGIFKTYHFSLSPKEQTLSIQEDDKGHIWVLSPLDGLFLFDESSDSFEKKSDIKNGHVLLLHKDQLIIGNEALHLYSIANERLKWIKTIPLENDLVTAIHPDQNDQYYVGTTNGHLFKIKDLYSPPQIIYGANEAHRVEKLDFGHIKEIYITQTALAITISSG